MSVTLNKKEELSGIHVNDMEDGQIAEIVSWTSHDYKGRIVQRYRDTLLTVGERSDHGWEGYFRGGRFHTNCHVRLLEPEETLTIKEN